MVKPMKKFVLSMVLCLCALGSVQAQNAQVANIRKMYAEAKAHHLIFSYTNAKEEGEQHEWRYYFDYSGRCVEVKGTDSKAGPGFADAPMADFYLALFQTLVSS